ncbi:cell cycle checkpoint control protein RAD9A isoform X2 [Aricia agestis]|uniref:cell cycle checkpoint control protein RAD9A isoform X2 n=1 Tax=Aricia agestis TaxID=91739 RepID=UPI001C2078F9|nr:cell cycle checkpoint control protein RAD9A isoform X2 [Aricia agestis]
MNLLRVFLFIFSFKYACSDWVSEWFTPLQHHYLGVTVATVWTMDQPARSYLVSRSAWSVCSGDISFPADYPPTNWKSVPKCDYDETPAEKPDPCIFNSIIKYSTIPSARRSLYAEDDYVCQKHSFSDKLEKYMSVSPSVIQHTCRNVLGRTIHALARFGDELCLESLPDSILLRTLNAAESAYAIVKFNKNFFSYFNYNYYSTEDTDGLKCKISMKSALNTFKSPMHMDKQVENLEIKLDPESCKLIFQLKCKHGIIKTHFVSVIDCKTMQAVYTKDQVPNRLTSSQRVLSEALSNFQSSDDQVTLDATGQVLVLRNYIDKNVDVSKIIRTQISIKPTEFDVYNISAETVITFTLKEFRALLAFAEALSLPIQLHFETTGKPAVFIVHNGNTFEAHFVLATSKPDSATQVTHSTQNSYVERKRKEKTVSEVAAKKMHLDNDVNNVSKCLDEDSHLFNYIDIPDEDMCIQKSNAILKTIGAKCGVELPDDFIPPSPTSKIKNVFKRCFESTFDPKSVWGTVLAENSDSD